MSKALITSVLSQNKYALKISGMERVFYGKGITLDAMTGGTVEIADIDNKPPSDQAVRDGYLRILPNEGEYVFAPSWGWVKWDELWKKNKKASLAKSFFQASRKAGRRWQKECPLYRIGTIVAIKSDTEVTVYIDSGPYPGGGRYKEATCEYMTCDCVPFIIGDKVILKFGPGGASGTVTVVGFWKDPKSCGPYIVLKWSYRYWPDFIFDYYYTVLDPKTGAIAVIKDPLNGSVISLPAKGGAGTPMERWLDGKSNVSMTDLYTWTPITDCLPPHNTPPVVCPCDSTQQCYSRDLVVPNYEYFQCCAPSYEWAWLPGTRPPAFYVQSNQSLPYTNYTGAPPTAKYFATSTYHEATPNYTKHNLVCPFGIMWSNFYNYFVRAGSSVPINLLEKNYMAWYNTDEKTIFQLFVAVKAQNEIIWNAGVKWGSCGNPEINVMAQCVYNKPIMNIEPADEYGRMTWVENAVIDLYNLAVFEHSYPYCTAGRPRVTPTSLEVLYKEG